MKMRWCVKLDHQSSEGVACCQGLSAKPFHWLIIQSFMLANHRRLHYYDLSSKATCERRAKYLTLKAKMSSEISRTSLPVWAIKLARLPYSPSMGNISRLWIWASGITENKHNQKGRCWNCCLDMSYEVFRSDVRQNQGFRHCCRRLREIIMTQKDRPVRARPVCLPSAGWADSKPALYAVLGTVQSSPDHDKHK